jgi:hypothetical protein
MADESKALQMIADVLQQLMSEGQQRKEALNQLREATVGPRPDLAKQRSEHDERMRQIRERSEQHHEEQKQLLQSLLAAVNRHNEAMEQHNLLIARILERWDRK